MIFYCAKWDDFKKVREKAKVSCRNSNINDLDHFVDVSKMVQLGSSAQREIEDITLVISYNNVDLHI